MDRSDANQEGVTLPPVNGNRAITREEIRIAVDRHLNLCPFSKLGIEKRVRSIENRFMLLLGFMVGSGFFGGVTGAAVFKMLGG